MESIIRGKASALAKRIQSQPDWDMDALKELCELADMSREWEAADGDTYESVAFAAAAKLGVELTA